MSNLSELSKNIKKMKEDLSKNFKESFIKEAQTVLDKMSPEVEAIGFIAYRPYFNDGDACLYGISSDCIVIPNFDKNTVGLERPSSWDEEEGSYDTAGTAEEYENSRWALSRYDLKKDSKFYKDVELAGEFVSMLSEIEDIVEAAFGDCRVYVTRNGDLYLEEYSHD